MRKLFIIAIGIGLLQVACNQSSSYQEGALTLNNASPVAGGDISLTYNTQNSILAGKEDINGVLYYVVHSTIYANDLNLENSSDSLLQDSFILPDSAQAFALLFSADETKDTNSGMGYIFPVYESERTIPGAYAAMSEFYTRRAQRFLEIERPADSALALMEKEFEIHPHVKENWNFKYLNLLAKVNKDSASKNVKNILQDSLAADTVTAKSLRKFHSLYRLLRNKEMMDSLETLINKQYPKGEFVLAQRISSLFRTKNIDTLKAEVKDIKNTFPPGLIKDVGMLSFIQSRIGRLYIDQKKYDEAARYLALISDPSTKAGSYNSIAWNLAQEGTQLGLADSLSMASLKILENQLKNPSTDISTYYTERQWKERIENSYGMYADTYAYVKQQKGQYEDALVWQKKSVEASKGKDPEINERYIEYQLKAGSADTALAKAAHWIIDGKATAKMDTLLKEAFVKAKGSDKGFASYKAELQAEADKKLREKLKKEQLDKPAPNFTLRDLNGNEFSLTDLRGKVVILDFWATWCGPCKVSFPGMQKAVEKFGEDEDVVFLFVNTWQREKQDVRKQKVSDFIKKNDYTFHVLLDEKIKDEQNKFQVVNKFNVTGIPTTFLIDGEGNIKFKTVGANSNIKKQVKEISTMVDIAQS